MSTTDIKALLEYREKLLKDEAKLKIDKKMESDLEGCALREKSVDFNTFDSISEPANPVVEARVFEAPKGRFRKMMETLKNTPSTLKTKMSNLKSKMSTLRKSLTKPLLNTPNRLKSTLFAILPQFGTAKSFEPQFSSSVSPYPLEPWTYGMTHNGFPQGAPNLCSSPAPLEVGCHQVYMQAKDKSYFQAVIKLFYYNIQGNCSTTSLPDGFHVVCSNKINPLKELLAYFMPFNVVENVIESNSFKSILQPNTMYTVFSQSEPWWTCAENATIQANTTVQLHGVTPSFASEMIPLFAENFYPVIDCSGEIPPFDPTPIILSSTAALVIGSSTGAAVGMNSTGAAIAAGSSTGMLGAAGGVTAGLSAGAVAGIAIGAILVASGATYVGIKIYRRCNPPKAPLTEKEKRIQEARSSIQANVDGLFANVSPAIPELSRDLIRVIVDYARNRDLNLDPKRNLVLDPDRTVLSQDDINGILGYAKNKDIKANPLKPKRRTLADWLQSLRQSHVTLTPLQQPALGLASSPATTVEMTPTLLPLYSASQQSQTPIIDDGSGLGLDAGLVERSDRIVKFHIPAEEILELGSGPIVDLEIGSAVNPRTSRMQKQ